MKQTLLIFLCLLCSLPAWADVNVFACEPEWASLLHELGGDKLAIHTATNAFQDPHHIQARPGLIAKMRRAQLVVCTGAELEIGWLPVLLRRAANPRVQPGTPGYFEAAKYITLLDKPLRLDRANGDVHAAGDPHIQTDPHNITKVAIALQARLEQIDPEDADYYRQRGAAFLQRWQTALKGWQIKAGQLAGMQVVTQHKSWRYLFKWLHIDVVARLEPKPGVPPSTAHLAEVLKLLKHRPARAIVRAVYQPVKATQWLQQRSGLPIVVLPFTVGGNKQATDLFGLFDSTLQILESIPRG